MGAFSGGAVEGGKHFFRQRIGGGQPSTQAAQAQKFTVHGGVLVIAAGEFLRVDQGFRRMEKWGRER